MERTLSFNGYSPKEMGNETVSHVAFSFHKEANWYKECCKEYNELDYYAKLYNLLEDKDLKDFWENLEECFKKVYMLFIMRYHIMKEDKHCIFQNVDLSMCLKAPSPGPHSRQRRAVSTNTARNDKNMENKVPPSGSTITKTGTVEENMNVQDKAPPSSSTSTTTSTQNDINIKSKAALSGKMFYIWLKYDVSLYTFQF